MPEHVDAYRIGYGPFFRIAARWRLHRAGYSWRLRPRSEMGTFYRRSSDRWRRCWQAEWDGCQRAVRAYTKAGVIRRATRHAASGDGGEA